MKKIIVLTLALVTSFQVLKAQQPRNAEGSIQPVEKTVRGNARITGSVIDASNQQSVDFATITLIDPVTGKTVDGILADGKGKFTIPNLGIGTYNALISFMGYETRTIPDVVIKSNNEKINLGIIAISPSATMLKEVTVQGQRAMIEEKVDRTVYNAENDAGNRGGDAADVLRKVPMLSVDLDGNVSMRGNQNIKVLINNRPSIITAGSVADALKQIPGDMIKSVEVITSPSAKYDAEGSAGIINIVTKKNTLQGGFLGIDTGVGLRASNLGLNGSYRTRNMGFSLGGFGRAGYNTNGSFENTQTRMSNTNAALLTKQGADTENNMAFGRYSFGWDYDINKNNFLTSSIQYGLRNFNFYQNRLFSRNYQNSILLNQNLRDVQSTDYSGSIDINLNYTHNFKKPQQEFSILTQFSHNNRTNDFINAIYSNDLTAIEKRLKNINDSFNQENTIQLDYQSPVAENQMIEFGGKQISRRVTSEYETLAAVGSDSYSRIQGSKLSNIFNYKQNVTAGYFSYTLTTPSKYSFKPGLRYEYTNINANFANGQDPQVNIPSYGVLVPSLSLSKRLPSGNTIKLAYNRRISRPSIQYLNPNTQAANPLNITIGNPNLDPEYTNNFELGYNTYIKKTSLTVSTFVRNTNNSIQSIRDLVGTDTIRTTFGNIGQEDAYGLSLFGNVNISNKLTLNGGFDSYYSVLNNKVSNPLYNASNEGMVFNIRAMGSYTIGNGWGFQGFGFYRAGQVQLQGTQGGFGIYSLNLRKDINNKKGSLGFGAENFFGKSIKIKNELTTPVLRQSSVNVMNNLSFRVNFSYRIGKITTDGGPRRRKKSVNNDDLKGGGGENSGESGAQQSGAPAGGIQPARNSAPVQNIPQGEKPANGSAPAKGTQKNSRE